MKHYMPIDLRDAAPASGIVAIAGGLGGTTAGDVNGDGLDDLIFGHPTAPGALPAAFGAGAAFVLYGRADGFPGSVDIERDAQGSGGFEIQGYWPSQGVGRAVATAGDVNGDGFDDLLLGVPGSAFFSPPGIDAGGGAAYIVFGREGGYKAPVNLGLPSFGDRGVLLRGEGGLDYAGVDVASAGDVNGDGFDDILIGARGAGPNSRYTGAAYVVFGRPDGFPDQIDLARVREGKGGFALLGDELYSFGLEISSAGDVNGDGFDDLVVGSEDAYGTGYAGAAYVVFGRAGGFASPIRLAEVAQGQGGFALLGDTASGGLGSLVAGGGDLNGDGLDDVVVGNRRGADPTTAELFVVHGRTDGFPATIGLDALRAGEGGFVIRGAIPGGTVAVAGDVNGDGFDDLIVGARYADRPDGQGQDAGIAYVVFGRAGGFGPGIDLAEIAEGRGGFAILGAQARDRIGFSVSTAGDVNGDGFDDLLAGGVGGSALVFGGGFQPGPPFTEGDDALPGGAGDQFVQGGAGNDTLRGGAGADTVAGGAGDDRLLGGRGPDVLSGGEGADRFVFGAADLGAVDRILDFDRAEGDRIVLRPIDAVAATPGDDAFAFIGTAAFGGVAGELRWEDRGGGLVRIEGDVDGDGAADLVIDLKDAGPVQPGWFVL